MAETSIEWTRNADGTRGRAWNCVTGCDRVSRGCDNCYAAAMAPRLKAMGQPKYQRDGDPRTSGPGFGLTVHENVLNEPYRWGRPTTVFVNSMSDLFHAQVPEEFIRRVWGVMADTPQHTYQILTKRAQRMERVVRHLTATFVDDDSILPNAWLGVSVETPLYYSRIRHLQRTPAAVRFLSCEPLLAPLPDLPLDGIHWAIIGGESGHGTRALDVEWVRDIVRQCRAAGVRPFVKQLGSVWAGRGKGGDMSLWPEDLRIREMPR